MFEATSDVSSVDADDIVRRDAKEYTVAEGRTICIAQIETVGLQILDRRDELQDALERLRGGKDYLLCALMVTDILAKNTKMLVAGDPVPLERAFGHDVEDGTLDLPGRHEPQEAGRTQDPGRAVSTGPQPSASYSVTIRVQLPHTAGSFARVAGAIGDTGAILGAIDLVRVADGRTVRDVTVSCADVAHGEAVVAAIERLDGVTVQSVSDRTFLMHRGGKIVVEPKIAITTRDDLSMAYTPGVARVSAAIHDDPAKAWTLTIKGNAVAVVTDGTAVLGLGDIGPAAAMPVMEGKAMLFKQFAGVDAFPLCLDTKDADEIVAFVKAVAPGFGGINLEDIAAPRCFEIERRLRAELDIPVFHDDQHGTAIVVLAALVNALRVVGKSAGEIKVVVVGAGAAGVACTEIILAHGVQNLVVCDIEGALYVGAPRPRSRAGGARGAHEPRRRARHGRRHPARRRRARRRLGPRGGLGGGGAHHGARPDRLRDGQPDPRDPARGGPRRRRDHGHRTLGLPQPDQQRPRLPRRLPRGARHPREHDQRGDEARGGARHRGCHQRRRAARRLRDPQRVQPRRGRGGRGGGGRGRNAQRRGAPSREPFVAGALIRQDGRVAGIAGATVTVIFADVEGSTALLERLGQARWMTALAEYEKLLGSRLDAHGGTLVKALGDGHLLAFPSANAALRCAVDVQRALPLTTAPDLRVRMGMHTGEPVALEDDLHGRTVVKAARIADLAHGGEVLVSGIVRELAETDADLEEEIWFEESREVELRGLRGRHLVLAAQWQRADKGPIRVVIADDSAIVRDGVAALLRECGVHVAGLATDPESLYREIERHRPDVALVDIRMPPTGTNEGLVAAEHIGREYPEVGVLVLSQYLELAYALRLVEGQEARRGYLIKDRVGEIETLLDAVRRVANGGCVVDPEIVERLVTRARVGGPLAQLSDREREVLGLIAEGLSDEAIAERLETTREAVESDADQIFAKLDLRDEGADRRVAAVLTYLRAT